MASRSAPGPSQWRVSVPIASCSSGLENKHEIKFYIALGAKVPIILACRDYAAKHAGLRPAFVPAGDAPADMAAVKAFYKPFKGRNPDRFEQAD